MVDGGNRKGGGVKNRKDGGVQGAEEGVADLA